MALTHGTGLDNWAAGVDAFIGVGVGVGVLLGVGEGVVVGAGAGADDVGVGGARPGSARAR